MKTILLNKVADLRKRMHWAQLLSYSFFFLAFCELSVQKFFMHFEQKWVNYIHFVAVGGTVV